MSDFLFKEFDEVSAQAWKQKIQVDLKGADYNETLLWNSNEGITVKPFYNKEDIGEVAEIKSNNWSICELIEVDSPQEANRKALDYLSRGTETILFKLNNEVSISELVKDIDSNISIHFSFSDLFNQSIEEIVNLNNTNYRLHFDPIGQLAKTGNWYQNLETDFSFTKRLAKANQTIAIDTSIYQNAGANCIQQVVYAVAHANEYLNQYQDLNELSFQFITATGSNYFFEIAKLRALRILFDNIVKEYNTKVSYEIFSLPSTRNKTIYDYNVNMLRTTTESMSAVLGGANTVCNLPYDYLYHNANEFGDRISRNQLLVLKSESSFDIVQNPSDGSYYIESLTQQIVDKALDIFKLIEQAGGFLVQLKEGVIQRKIKESAQKEQDQFDSGEIVLLGTNKYSNEKDLMANSLEKKPFVKKESRKTLIEPIISKRLSEKLDLERLKRETQSN